MSERPRSRPATRPPPSPSSTRTATKVKLSRFKGRKVLVYFYPKADTPGCTTQSCGLRDIAGDIGDTAILGISPDSPAKQKKFDDKYSLGFPLLSDTEHAVAEAYGVWGEKKIYGKTYMGIVRSAFLDRREGQGRAGLVQDQPQGHPEEAAEGPGRRVTACPPPDRRPPAPPAVPASSTRSSSSSPAASAAGRGASPATRPSSPVTSRAGPRCPGC